MHSWFIHGFVIFNRFPYDTCSLEGSEYCSVAKALCDLIYTQLSACRVYLLGLYAYKTQKIRWETRFPENTRGFKFLMIRT